MQYQAKTQNGYNLMEAISALQKDIRRGNEEDAYYWALELAPQYEAYLWRRLIVIVNEDIGIANVPLLLLVPQQRAAYFEMRSTRNGNGSAKLILATTILALCRSPKSRVARRNSLVRAHTHQSRKGRRAVRHQRRRAANPRNRRRISARVRARRGRSDDSQTL